MLKAGNATVELSWNDSTMFCEWMGRLELCGLICISSGDLEEISPTLRGDETGLDFEKVLD